MSFSKNINEVTSWFSLKTKELDTFMEDNRKNLNEKINNYYDSDSYERDLDSFLNSFSSSYYEEKDFNIINDRSTRIQSKEQQARKKAMAFTVEGGIKGLTFSMPSGNPAIIAKSALAGASLSMSVIVYKSSKIIVKRVVNGFEESSFELVIV